MVSKLKFISVVTLVTLSICLSGLFTGCPEDPAVLTDGTITIRMIDAEAHNGLDFVTAVAAEGDIYGDHLGSNADTITGGICESLIYDDDTHTTIVVFTGGVSYDTGGFIDIGSNGGPTSGEDWITDPIKTIVVDGNM
ncbi:MAG: hypothetical protein KAQ93_08625, partial [Spirochaetales bacterium]|nr:hypothetical protein [Spirochaetales bacterium]